MGLLRLPRHTVAFATALFASSTLFVGHAAQQSGGPTGSKDALSSAPDLKVKYEKGPHTREEFETLMKQSSNWGRWGKDDQLGALNLITPEKRKQALASAKHGIAV